MLQRARVLNKGKPLVFEDITKPESEMTDTIGHSIFMVHFPEEKEAFDMKRVAEAGTPTGSVDLVIRGVGEIVDWSMMIDGRRANRGVQGEQSRPDAVQLAHGPAQKRARTGARTWDRALYHVAHGRDHIRSVCLHPRKADRCEPSSSFSGNETTFTALC